ncbi:MAG TPA: GntR family transcriptional regulator [Caulobacteraceae bacterium]|nr:GntR family transcriptional regulator [Caulobacteraceae bacterium]
MHTIQQSALNALKLEDTGAPIYVQLRDQLLGLIGSGRLRPGDQMPTMRQVAVALKIDLNTARRAYDELERLGAISLARGRGSFVSEHPPAPAPERQAERIDDLARQVIARARTAGLDPRDVALRITVLEGREKVDTHE